MSARARIGKVLRRWADRIDDDNVIPIVIKVPPGTLEQIRMTPARPSSEFLTAVDRARARQQVRDMLEERIPKDLNLWAAAAVVGLHNHTAEQACDDTCTTYEKDT